MCDEESKPIDQDDVLLADIEMDQQEIENDRPKRESEASLHILNLLEMLNNKLDTNTLTLQSHVSQIQKLTSAIFNREPPLVTDDPKLKELQTENRDLKREVDLLKSEVRSLKKNPPIQTKRKLVPTSREKIQTETSTSWTDQGINPVPLNIEALPPVHSSTDSDDFTLVTKKSRNTKQTKRTVTFDDNWPKLTKSVNTEAWPQLKSTITKSSDQLVLPKQTSKTHNTTSEDEPSMTAAAIVAQVLKRKEQKDSQTNVVLRPGADLEKTAKLAIIGDSNIKGLMNAKSLNNWVRKDNVLIRCARGGTVENRLKMKSLNLPADNDIENVILSTGGNDLADFVPELRNLQSKKGNQSVEAELLTMIASNIVTLAKTYLKTGRNVGVLLLPLRYGFKKVWVNTINKYCIDKFDALNIKYFDVADHMSQQKDYMNACLFDHNHLRYDYFSFVLKKLCEKMNINFQPSLDGPTEINWSETFRGMCIKCGSKRHVVCLRRVYQDHVCSLCNKPGHTEKVCKSLYEQCKKCGMYGHCSSNCGIGKT